MVTLPIIVDQWFTLPARLHAHAPTQHGHPPAVAAVTFCALLMALCLGFCAAFWWNTRGAGTEGPSKTGLALLLFQLALSFAFTETMFIISAELPFMMPVRAARKWLVAQCALLLAATAVALSMRDFVPADSLLHTPLAISVPSTILYMLAWTWFAFGMGYLAVSETRTHQDLARANSELMATQALLANETRLAERLRISRDLHDVVGHHLTGLSINLQLATHLVEGPAAKPVDEAFLVAKLLLAEVREVVGGLRDFRQTDLRRVFELLCRGIEVPRIHLELADQLDQVDPLCAQVLLRCAQEAITNVIKHAAARNLWIELNRSDSGWILRIRDDGRGSPSIAPGNGLKGMMERLKEVGGELTLSSRAGEGFALQACILAPTETL